MCNDSDNFSHVWILPLKLDDVSEYEKGDSMQSCEKGVPTDPKIQQQVWGTPWTPEEFIEQAVAPGHPALLGGYLPETLTSLSMSPAERIAMRAKSLKFWLRRSLKRGSSDSEIHAQLDPGVEKVLRGKRIALWKEMFASMEYEDIGVVDEFCSGATLTGPTCPTGLWAKQFTPATLTEDELRQQAAAQRCSLTYSQVAFFSEEIAKSVWEQALEEVAKGELEGPISLEDVPPDIPISRRFGVEQGGKIRCVDDFSASGVNAAAQPLENPKFLL